MTWCEVQIEGVCGPWALHRHHRKLRSQGGDDAEENLLTVCLACHAYIHDHPSVSYEKGWIVKSFQDPKEVMCAKAPI